MNYSKPFRETHPILTSRVHIKHRNSTLQILKVRKKIGRSDGRTDERTVGRTDGRSGGRTHGRTVERTNEPSKGRVDGSGIFRMGAFPIGAPSIEAYA